MTTASEQVDAQPDLIKKRARSILVRNVAIGLVLMYMIFTSAIQTWSAFTSDESRDTIVDCVTPNGECNTRNQQETGAVVQKIIDEVTTTREVSLLAAACATDPELRPLTNSERVNAIDQCVQHALRERKRDQDAQERAD